MVDLPITKWIKTKIRRLIGIVEDTDVATHSIASGKYVVWKGDLYKSTAAIAVGGTLSLSNLSPVSDGGFNELSEQITKQAVSISSSNGTISKANAGKVGNLVVGSFEVNLSSSTSAGGTNIATISEHPLNVMAVTCIDYPNDKSVPALLNTSGQVFVYGATSKNFYVSFAFFNA